MKQTNPPTIPMELGHQDQILGTSKKRGKTSTLRYESFPLGDYIMIGASGASHGSLRVTAVTSEPIWWAKLTDTQKLELAQAEGYDTTDAFERAARRLKYNKFIDGLRGMWRHTIEPVLPMAVAKTFEELMPQEPPRSGDGTKPGFRAPRNQDILAYAQQVADAVRELVRSTVAGERKPQVWSCTCRYFESATRYSERSFNFLAEEPPTGGCSMEQYITNVLLEKPAGTTLRVWIESAGPWDPNAAPAETSDGLTEQIGELVTQEAGQAAAPVEAGGDEYISTVRFGDGPEVSLERLQQAIDSFTAELTAFNLANRPYDCHVEKINVTKQVDSQSGFIDQHSDFLIAVHVKPYDLVQSDLLTAAFLEHPDGSYTAAPGDLKKFTDKKSTNYRLEIGEDAYDESDKPYTKWRRLEPSVIHLPGVDPGEDKETVDPISYVLLLAKGLPHYLAGELWYPNTYRLRIIEVAHQTTIEDFTASAPDTKQVTLDQAIADAGAQPTAGATAQDELLDAAWESVNDTGDASISLLQRSLGIGYNRAASIMDQLEAAGRVSAPDAEGKRQVIREVELDEGAGSEPSDRDDDEEAYILGWSNEPGEEDDQPEDGEDEAA